jgi:hypothetical protein
MKLVDKLLSVSAAFTKFIGKLTVLGQLIVVGALIFFIVSFKGCSQPSDAAELKLKVQQTTIYADSLKQSITHLQQVVSEKDSKIAILIREVSVKQNTRYQLKVKQVALENKIMVETDTGILVFLQDTTITNLKEQIAIADTIIIKKDEIIFQREAQVNLLQTAIVASTNRGDSLQTTLNTTLSKYAKKDKFFKIFPMPSRKLVATTALIAGVYAGTQLTK